MQRWPYLCVCLYLNISGIDNNNYTLEGQENGQKVHFPYPVLSVTTKQV